MVMPMLNKATTDPATRVEGPPRTPKTEAPTMRSSWISEISGASAVMALRRFREVRMMAASVIRRGVSHPATIQGLPIGLCGTT